MVFEREALGAGEARRMSRHSVIDREFVAGVHVDLEAKVHMEVLQLMTEGPGMLTIL